MNYLPSAAEIQNGCGVTVLWSEARFGFLQTRVSLRASLVRKASSRLIPQRLTIDMSRMRVSAASSPISAIRPFWIWDREAPWLNGSMRCLPQVLDETGLGVVALAAHVLAAPLLLGKTGSMPGWLVDVRRDARPGASPAEDRVSAIWPVPSAVSGVHRHTLRA